MSFVLVAACSSPYASDLTVDARDGTAPIAFGGGGIPVERPPTIFGSEMSLTLQFLFTNTSDRPQNVEFLQAGYRGDLQYGLEIAPSTTKIARMIDPGEDFEVEVVMRGNLERLTPTARGRGVVPASFRVMLKMGDGTSYLYPVEIGIPIVGSFPAR